ncbi:class I SAM-dependent methyltransferase [Pararhizobium sp. BT-229]|uniref:class I SAM-dependent methyltransferase n=1 Tax=Pararhizobium sp. BT-229 TaxID=2986923 RepID=UPI0021F6D09A|nr:class I SAM-dependent methyltransferase [Pararhizobium sp. BT-229]MCV9964384.1 class I SAM-dependent methyltransferase [Pararhizobium sp. BT-229]
MSVDEVLRPAEAYDLSAPFYDAWSWQAFWREHEFPLVRAEIEAFENGSMDLIDLGCGTGHYLGLLAPSFSRSVGVDISDGMLSVARLAHPSVEFVRADIEDLPFGDNSFDVALSCRAMTHLADPGKVLSEIARTMRSKGIAIVTNIDHGPKFGNTRLPTAGEATVFATTFKHAPDDLARIARACGLERTGCRYITMYGEPVTYWDEDIVGSVAVFRKS